MYVYTIHRTEQLALDIVPPLWLLRNTALQALARIRKQRWRRLCCLCSNQYTRAITTQHTVRSAYASEFAQSAAAEGIVQEDCSSVSVLTETRLRVVRDQFLHAMSSSLSHLGVCGVSAAESMATISDGLGLAASVTERSAVAVAIAASAIAVTVAVPGLGIIVALCGAIIRLGNIWHERKKTEVAIQQELRLLISRVQTLSCALEKLVQLGALDKSFSPHALFDTLVAAHRLCESVQQPKTDVISKIQSLLRSSAAETALLFQVINRRLDTAVSDLTFLQELRAFESNKECEERASRERRAILDMLMTQNSACLDRSRDSSTIRYHHTIHVMRMQAGVEVGAHVAAGGVRADVGHARVAVLDSTDIHVHFESKRVFEVHSIRWSYLRTWHDQQQFTPSLDSYIRLSRLGPVFRARLQEGTTQHAVALVLFCKDTNLSETIQAHMRYTGHPCIAPIRGIAEGTEHRALVFDSGLLTLHDIIHHNALCSAGLWSKMSLRSRCEHLSQVVEAVSFLHTTGRSHGALTTTEIFQDRRNWLSISDLVGAGSRTPPITFPGRHHEQLMTVINSHKLISREYVKEKLTRLLPRPSIPRSFDESNPYLRDFWGMIAVLIDGLTAGKSWSDTVLLATAEGLSAVTDFILGAVTGQVVVADTTKPLDSLLTLLISGCGRNPD